MYRARYVRPNERSSTPTSCVVLATLLKWHPSPGGARPLHTATLDRGCLIHWRQEKGRATRRDELVFDRREEAIAWIQRHCDARKRTWLFGHGIGQSLTALQFWRAWESGAFRPATRRKAPAAPGGEQATKRGPSGVLVIDDPPVILDLETCEGHRCTLVDVCNYLPMTLAELAEALGMRAPWEPGDAAEEADVIECVRHRAAIAERAVRDTITFVRRHDLGNWRYTMAGQSMALYRHRCITESIAIPLDPAVKEMEREAYFGLGARVFYAGKVGVRQTDLFGTPDPDATTDERGEWGPVYRLDVNSCYPAVMADNLYPVEYVGFSAADSPSMVLRRMEGQGAVARVTIWSDAEPYPIREDGQVVWARGNFPTTLAGEDLRAALKAGHVRAVESVQYYRLGKPFAKFCEAVWELMREYKGKNRLLYVASKILAVSLYGKFGQKAHRWELDPSGRSGGIRWGTHAAFDVDTGEIQSWRVLGGSCLREAAAGEGQDSWPVIAAYVCAYARSWLTRLIRIAGPRSVYYWDADSIHTSAEGYARLRDAGELSPDCPGKLKVEQVAKSAEYRGPKHYRLDDEWVIPGVRAQTRIDGRKMARDRHDHTLLSDLGGEPPEGPVREDVVWRLPQGKVEAIVQPDGWTQPVWRKYG